MFSGWAFVIFYFILMAKFGAETNTTSVQVIPLVKSQYDRMMIVRRNYWKVKTKHELIKDNWKRIYRIDKVQQKKEIKRCRSRLQDERDQFDMKFKQIESEINSLKRYRFLSIVKNEISQFNLHAIHFSPNMKLINLEFNPSDRQAQFEELRRQIWDYLFENRMDLKEIKNILFEISQAGIHYKYFSKRIALGYEIIRKELKVKRLDDVSVLEELPDFNRTITGDSETTEATTKEPTLYVVRSKYEQWMNLVNEIPVMRKKLHSERKKMKEDYSAELKAGDKIRDDLYMQIYHQKVDCEKNLWKLKHRKNSLIYFRYLTILQNHIEEYERVIMNPYFNPDMNEIKIQNHTKTSQDEEIRRQRWNWILEHLTSFKIIQNLITEIDAAGIQHSDFSAGIARGHKVISHHLRPKKLYEITPMRELPDFSKNITGDFLVDRCLVVLMEDYKKKNTPKPESSE